MPFLSAFLIALLLLGAPAFAETGQSPLDKASKREVSINENGSSSEYLHPTLENLAKLYWKLGVFDLNDDSAIDNFLRINECGIFTSYFNDDFEWAEIREATRQKIKQNMDEYPDKFKFILPINLGEYDEARGGFEIINNTGFPHLKRIEFLSPMAEKLVCNTFKNVPDYEKSVLLILEKPLDYTFVKMDDHVAQAFILRKKQEAEELDEKIRVKRYERTAYVRLNMSVKEYQGNIKGSRVARLAILYGQLDSIDIFDDPEEKLLLTSYDYTNALPADAAQ